jgi:hypothetical protein
MALCVLPLAISIFADDLAAEPPDSSRNERRIGPAQPLSPRIRVKIVTKLEVEEGQEKLKGMETQVVFIDGLRSRSEGGGLVLLRGLEKDPLATTAFGDPRQRAIVVPGPTEPIAKTETSELPLSTAQPSSRGEDLGTQKIQGRDATGIRWIFDFPARAGMRERPYTHTVEIWKTASGDWIRERTSSSFDSEVSVTDVYDLPVAELPQALFEIPDGAQARVLGPSGAQP